MTTVPVLTGAARDEMIRGIKRELVKASKNKVAALVDAGFQGGKAIYIIEQILTKDEDNVFELAGCRVKLLTSDYYKESDTMKLGLDVIEI